MTSAIEKFIPGSDMTMSPRPTQFEFQTINRNSIHALQIDIDRALRTSSAFSNEWKLTNAGYSPEPFLPVMRKIEAQMRRPLAESLETDIMVTSSDPAQSADVPRQIIENEGLKLTPPEGSAWNFWPIIVPLFDMLAYALLGLAFTAFIALWGSLFGGLGYQPIFLLTLAIFSSLLFSVSRRASKELRKNIF